MTKRTELAVAIALELEPTPPLEDDRPRTNLNGEVRVQRAPSARTQWAIHKILRHQDEFVLRAAGRQG